MLQVKRNKQHSYVLGCFREPSGSSYQHSEISRTFSEDELYKRCTKGTQIDLPLPSWKYLNNAQRMRPTTSGYFQKLNRVNDTYPTYGSKQPFHLTQSEITLNSLQHRQNNKYVALDMITPPHIARNNSYNDSNYMEPLSSSCNTCCCMCMSNRSMQSRRTLNLEDEDSPQGLSWRRLHMSRAKLKATATTSELLSGFAMVAMVELQINEPTAVPEWLFVMFAVCTTVLVSVHIFALMISTYLLPNVEAISKLQIARLVTESPHERMRGFIELAWAFSTVLGLFLFLVEVAILCWVKFWDYSFTAATASTIIVIPVLIVFIAFAVHFYHSLVVYKCEATVSDMKELESIRKNLDNVTISQSTV
ncbi:calcium release-activated calcium channel protein 1 isoform X2 [Diprion similis]|uniref:calcium release-activated calcium channel protein 1 isoform X2 n=1 Tax=Diprion similis TaxID=362088 RepID=UPI001EF97A17|nr:calcium release-activated calcium channel protein 1 isoform X2 [Diprion similis]